MKYCYHCMTKMGEDTVCPNCGNDNQNIRNAPYAIQPGMVLNGKYLIGKVLGQGGFGITYMGMDLALEVKVAIKEYYVVSSASRDGAKSQTIYWMNDPGNVDHFMTEARRMAMLQAMPEVARVRDVFYKNNTAYIVMEYVMGEDLKHHLQKNGIMSYAQTVKLMLPVIRALGQVHEKGLIHRDISPDNLMMETKGTLRVLDMGAAGDLNRNDGRASQLVARKGFSPYEQYIENGEIGPWTDVYAVCATIYYCCSGKVIPDAFSRIDTFMQTNNSALEFVPGIPPAGADVLQRGLALEAADRIRSMQELAEDLEASLENPNAIVKRKKKAGKKPEKKKTGAGKWVLIAAVLAAVIGVGIFAGSRMEQPDTMQVVPEESREIAPTSESEAAAIPQETETTIPETTEAAAVPLALKETMDIQDINLGDTVEIELLSGPEREEINWTSSNIRVAEISQSGVLTATGYGSTRVTGEYEGQTSVCTVTVTLKGNVECRYTSNLTGWTVTGYRGELPADAVMPKFIEGKPVTEISIEVFSRCRNLNSMVIPDSITVIPSGLFTDCTSMTSVTLPDSIQTIRENAFKGCSGLTRLILPEGLTEIKESAFEGCTGLTRITIPDSVVTTGKSVFEDCTGLTRVTLGEGLQELGDYAFQNCSLLNDVKFGSSLVTIGKYAFSYCSGLTKVELPEGLVTIRQFAFNGCQNITSLSIPESVKDIGWQAFDRCYGLTTVKVRKDCNYATNSFPGFCQITFY